MPWWWWQMDFFKGFSCSNSPGVGCLFGTFKKALSSFSFCCHTFKMTHLLSEKPFFGAKLYFFSEGKQTRACGIESYREKKYSRVTRPTCLVQTFWVFGAKGQRVLSSDKEYLVYYKYLVIKNYCTVQLKLGIFGYFALACFAVYQTDWNL